MYREWKDEKEKREEKSLFHLAFKCDRCLNSGIATDTHTHTRTHWPFKAFHIFDNLFFPPSFLSLRLRVIFLKSHPKAQWWKKSKLVERERQTERKRERKNTYSYWTGSQNGEQKLMIITAENVPFIYCNSMPMCPCFSLQPCGICFTDRHCIWKTSAWMLMLYRINSVSGSLAL